MDQILHITHPDGTTSQHAIGAQIVVGRSENATIALPRMAELEPEHLLLSAQPVGCWVAVAKGARTPATVLGRRFEQGVVPWGTEIAIGALRLRVGTGESARKAAPALTPKGIAIILTIPLIGWLFLTGEEDGTPGVTQAAPPALFGDGAPCPGEPAEAAARAVEANEIATAKRDRYAFDAQDGVEAVEQYALAESCFARAGKGDEAAAVRSARAPLERQILEDYKTLVLRLERSLKGRRLATALGETRQLLTLLGARDDPYTRWLRTLRQRLTLKLRPTTKGK